MRRLVLSVVSVIPTLLLFLPIAAEDQSVTWTNLVNVTVNGTVLQKASGCDGCDDAGATSARS